MVFRPGLFLSVLCSLVGLLACQTPTTEPSAVLDAEYFPLETGHYIIYDVQEQVYNLNSTLVQRTYQLKEQVGAAYTDVTGQKAYRLMRYQRTAETDAWQADSVWSARVVNQAAIRTENGQDFVKLLFPVGDVRAWDGNRYNTFGPDDYTTRNVGQPYPVQNKSFSQTVTVVEQDDSTLTSQDKRVEVYARQVGLIYKERTQLHFCTATPACTGHSQIDYGIRQIYRIRTYGNE